MTLGGPTSWSPLIDAAVKMVHKSQEKAQRPKFHLLVIIGDGQASDQRDTIEAIVRASAVPLVILMIGVGDGPWQAIDRYDYCLKVTRC